MEKKKIKNKVRGFHFYIEFSDKESYPDTEEEIRNLIFDHTFYKKIEEEQGITDLYEYWDYLRTFLRKEYSIYFSYRPALKPRGRLRLLPQSHDFVLADFAPDLTYNDLIIINEALTQYETWKLTEREREYFKKTISELQETYVKTAIF